MEEGDTVVLEVAYLQEELLEGGVGDRGREIQVIQQPDDLSLGAHVVGKIHG